eukprot:3997124-Pyramimonas_sp.AAC.1
MQEAWVYSHNGPIRRRKRGYILTTDRSIRRGKRRSILTTDQETLSGADSHASKAEREAAARGA